MNKLLLPIVFVALFSGCRGLNRLIIGESESLAPCSKIPVQDFSGTDIDVMNQLTFDQHKKLDSQFQFFDSRVGSIQYIRDLYNHAQSFPPAPASYSCLEEPEFRRVVEASVNLGRFPL